MQAVLYMKAQNQNQVISEMIDNPNKIVVSNPLTVLRFNKPEGKSFIPVTTQEIGVFIPKIVWETISLLTTADFSVIEGDIITKRIYVRDFMSRIGGDEKNYKYVIDAARVLRAWEIASINDKGQEVYRGFFNDVIHDKKSGYIDFKISKEWAIILLDIAQNGNVSFLKQRIFDLQNSHAINLYPTLKAYCFRKKFSISIDDFRKKFGYATTGYNKYSNLYIKVIQPALDELNAKSDLMVNFEAEGTNLQGSKPRITGLTFLLKEKLKEPQKETIIAKPEKIKTIVINANIPTVDEIKKIGVNAGFSEENCIDILDICDNNLVRGWELIKGYIEVKDKGQPILRPLGYIFKGKDNLGAGLWAKNLESNSKVDSKQLVKLLNDLQNEYRRRRTTQQQEFYSKSSDSVKVKLTEMIKNDEKFLFASRNIALDEKQQNLNNIGIEIAGEILAIEQNQGPTYRQDYFKSEVYRKHGIEIQFNNKDEVITN